MSKYPWQVIDPKDFIYLEANQSLSMQDIHVLTKLYQPIIGGGAHSLYQTLFAELDFQANNKDLMISRLLTKLDVGIPDFYNARIRLEGIGLLRIYESDQEQGNYFYQLIPPLSAKEFFKDSLLRTLLIEKIGERLFQEELDHLLTSTNIKKSYKETTRSFLDVYHFDVNNSDVLNHTDFMPFESVEQPKIAKTIENVDSFDYDFFKAGLSRHFIREGNLPDEIKELIYTFHVVYGIDEMAMQSLILESADVESGQINKNKFIQIVQRSYFNQQKAQGIKSNQMLQEEILSTTGDEVEKNIQSGANQKDFNHSEKSVINHAKQTAPAIYLQSIKDQKNGFVTTNETWILKELVEQSPLSKEVINILLHYILVVQETVILEKNYAMKIANDWAQNGVKTAEDAVAKVKEIYNQPKKSTPSSKNKQYSNNYRRPGKKETLPEWAKEKESNKKQQQEEQISVQEEDALKVRLDQIRRMREEKEDS